MPLLLYLLARLETRFGPQKTNLIGTGCGTHWLEDKALWPLTPMGPRPPRRCPPHTTHYEKGAPYKTIGVEFGRKVRDLYVRELLTTADGDLRNPLRARP